MKPEEVEERVRRVGYSHVPGPIDEETFLAIADALGTIVRDEPVRLYETKRRVHLPERIHLHTDQPYVHFIGWHCIAQDDPPIPNELLLIADVIRDLSREVLEGLQRVHIEYPEPDAQHERIPAPVVLTSRGERQFFCIPWYVSEDLDPQAEAAWRDFKKALEIAASKQVSFSLAPGDALFINNKTCLHGRPALSKRSRRHLRRLWLRSKSPTGLPIADEV